MRLPSLLLLLPRAQARRHRADRPMQGASIGLRMALAFGLVLSLFAGTTLYAVLQMRGMEREMSQVLESSVRGGALAGTMRRSIDEVYINTTMLLLTTQVDEVELYSEAVAKARKDYDASKSELLATTKGVEMASLKQATAQISEAEIVLSMIDQFVSRRTGLVSTLGAGQTVESDETTIPFITGNLKGQFDFWVTAVDAVAAATRAMEDAHQAEARSAARIAQVVQIVASVTALLIGSLAGWVITRNVTRPLHQAVSVAERVAQGDLSIAIPKGKRDEAGALLDSLSTMQASLNGLVSEVRQSAGSIASASAEVAMGNIDLSDRTEKSAGELQRTTSSLVQLSDTVRESAASARSADELARNAAEAAKRGGEEVAKVAQSMQDITAQSKRIGDIIGVIDGIAFQTNILALNAAVEAARAGEQGRGFAVVASEVRHLAQRSAAAAKDIKSLIQASVGSIESGGLLVQSACRNMEGIVSSVGEVTVVINQISQSSASQSDDLSKVSGALGDIDQLTQQNAALVEQSAAAAESLKSQSQRLIQLVSTFRLAEVP